MYYVPADEKKQYDYITYPRQFVTYRWYKPLITTLLMMIFTLALLILIVVGGSMMGRIELGLSTEEFIKLAKGGYDSMDLSSITGILINLVAVSVMIPALMLARAIVRDRTWASYSSSRGGWDMGLYIKCQLIAIIVISCPIVGRHIYMHDYSAPDMNFSRVALILILIFGPLQCIAEEYVFRGLFTQTLGSWFRIPIVAIILAALPFVVLHPYNNLGKISILLSGIGFGLAAWIGRGIEASSAMHIGNNLIIFLTEMLGMISSSGEVEKQDVIFSFIIEGIYILIIFILSKKTHWFDKVRKNDAEIFNSKINAKRSAKAQKRARKGGRSYSGDVQSKAADYSQTADSAETGAYGAESSSPSSSQTGTSGASSSAGNPASSASRRSGGRSGSYQGKHFKH